MDCKQAQDRLLNADTAEPEAWGHDLDAHVAMCSECQTLIARLRRLEEASRALPTVSDAALTRRAFLDLLAPAKPAAEPTPYSPRRLLRLRRSEAFSGRRLAMAGSILVVLGTVAWLVWFQGVQKAAASDAVVDRLVDWNVRLGSAESLPQRQQIYLSLAPTLQRSDGSAPVKPADQALAQKLLQSGKSLSQSVEPLDDAEQFADVADVLLDRMDTAVNTGDTADVERLSNYYGRMTTERFARKLVQVHSGNDTKGTKHERLEHQRRREREIRARLDKLLEKSPESTRKKILRELKGDGNHDHL